MKNTILFLAQLFVIWLIYIISDYAVTLLHLPIPASVLGIIFLYICLSSKIIKLSYIEKAVVFLNNHLAFFFLPYAVGLMSYAGLIKASGFQLIGMIILSTLIGLLVSSGLSQAMTKKEEEPRYERSNSL
ncbi:CidA/LrgA family protein [Sediminibacillus massiliensis]|uniref:CidA/LrgA family protein n=1 Tax=Sediminibacillus massiliensis TaxID=1926277 RepID=UPI00098832BE|nr:CidA/LrgA family protein [Sediminibacillus massiliensis]